MTKTDNSPRLDRAIEHVLKWEGGFRFVNDAFDAGGPTVAGVTIETWRLHGYDNDADGDIDVNDLKMINFDQWLDIIREQYWRPAGCDLVDDQLVADLLLDYGWGSGVRTSTRRVQRALNHRLSSGLSVDGLFGPITARAVNEHNPQDVAKAIYEDRVDFYYLIAGFNTEGKPVERPTERQIKNRRFLTGWHNRAVDLIRGRLLEPYKTGNSTL